MVCLLFGLSRLNSHTSPLWRQQRRVFVSRYVWFLLLFARRVRRPRASHRTRSKERQFSRRIAKPSLGRVAPARRRIGSDRLAHLVHLVGQILMGGEPLLHPRIRYAR